MYRIFVVEADAVIAGAVKRHLELWGWEVETAKDFNNFLHEFAQYDPQLVLIDISSPFFNGYHWCSEIRKVSKTPIIFIYSASDNMNIVMAMNISGDDFIAKPFDLQPWTFRCKPGPSLPPFRRKSPGYGNMWTWCCPTSDWTAIPATC